MNTEHEEDFTPTLPRACQVCGCVFGCFGGQGFQVFNKGLGIFLSFCCGF